MTELINKFIDFVFELLLFVRPDILINADIMINITTYTSYVLDLLKAVNFIIPIPLIYVVLFSMVSLKITLFMLWIVNWVIKRIFDVIP